MATNIECDVWRMKRKQALLYAAQQKAQKLRSAAIVFFVGIIYFLLKENIASIFSHTNTQKVLNSKPHFGVEYLR